MRIAQIAPLHERVPPKMYGGTERVVAFLSDELVSLGCDVTLFASGDSVTSANLVRASPISLRLSGCGTEVIEAELVNLIETVFSFSERFDVLHFHLDMMHLPLVKRSSFRHITTIHGRLDLEPKVRCYAHFDSIPFVSISHSQRRPMPRLNWVGNIPHGLPEDAYHFRDKPDGYLAFLGRISPEKGVHRAIEIARKSRIPLRVAAKIDPHESEYSEFIFSRICGDVEFIGEIGESEKNNFLGGAIALLFPIEWPEPFGLVMIESLACGTPVIAFPCGSVPEVIEDGKTGYIVGSTEEAVCKVDKIDRLSRYLCRLEFERRFSASRMANDYLKVYRELVFGGKRDESQGKWQGENRTTRN